ncbi:MAG: ribonuclease P protein component [Acidobacteriota bacterium]
MRFVLPKECRIAKTAEFRLVYSEGKRFNGRFMTLFLRPSPTEIHRLGVTASKKGIGKAHERFRAKRLLREAFRLSRIELDELLGKYDWVLNAKRGLLKVKLESPLQDFRQLIESVRNSELELNKGEVDAK